MITSDIKPKTSTNKIYRVAPSPTGMLHLGQAKTYIINYILAKQNNGKLIFRVDDTDAKRNQLEHLTNMIKDIQWLGIRYDLGPIYEEKSGEVKKNEYFQSERNKIYKDFIDKLLESGKAFKAYETPEEREIQITEARNNKKLPIYSGGHENLTKEEQEEFEKQGRKPVIRLKVELNQEVTFNDGVFGVIKVNTNSFGSFTILKSDGSAMYNFASILDDHVMGVTDIIRGREHITNTHKQIIVLKSLGLEIPNFAHYTSILNESGNGKLSKRKGAKPLSLYRAEGYLPEAIINYIIVISCSFSFKDKSQEIMSFDEILDVFSIKKLLKTNSRFNSRKLDWFNGQHIRRLSDENYLVRLYNWLLNESDQISNLGGGVDNHNVSDLRQNFLNNWDKIQLAALLVKERIDKFADIFSQLSFISNNIEISKVDFAIISTDIKTLIVAIEEISNLHESLSFPLNQNDWEMGMREIATKMDMKAGDIFMTLRLIIVGSRYSPPLLESMNVIGKEECLKRIQTGLVYLTTQEYNLKTS